MVLVALLKYYETKNGKRELPVAEVFKLIENQ
jgi:hypothetical protein